MAMSSLEDEIGACLGRAEWIGVIGSPSDNLLLNVELLETAYDRGIVGNSCIIEFMQDGKKNYALGQITSVQLRNPHIEKHPIQKIISSRGEANPLTETHDIRRIEINIGVVYSIEGDTLKPGRMGSIPPTGTRVYLLDQNTLDKLMEPYKKNLFYIGKIYNTDILLPMIFKHFGSGESGAGEAYHIGIFGKTGSGKSILAIMIMCAYAKYKDMSIFVLDPQGQFSNEFKKNKMVRKILEGMSRKIEIISLHNLVLSGYSLFKEILINSEFLKRRCNIIHPDNQKRAADVIKDILEGKISDLFRRKFKLQEIYKKDAFEHVWNTLSMNEDVQKRIYKDKERRETMVSVIQSADKKEVYEEWKSIAKLFTNKEKENPQEIRNLIKKIVEGGRILIVDLSETPEDIYWNEQIENIVLGEFLYHLIKEAEECYKKGKLLNTLVILDEAHRFAPREKTENEYLESVKNKLIEGVRTTRKYGLGWMFISQTLSSLHKEIINQIRIFIFGFGLAWGIERQALREIIGGAEEAFKLYQSFHDPQSGLYEKEYSFMAVGPISPLSASGTPIFFTALNYPEEFLERNFPETKRK